MPDNKPTPTPEELQEMIDRATARLGAPDRDPEAGPSPDATQPEKDEPIDWSKYELDPEFAHLYPKSEITETESGTQIVAPWFQMRLDYVTRKDAARIEHLVNGPDQWQIAAIVPNGYNSVGFVLQRMVKRALPVPELIQTETVVEEPTDEELKQTEDAALAWAGQTPAADAAADEAAGALEGADFGDIPTAAPEVE